jgi:hypothetical protein
LHRDRAFLYLSWIRASLESCCRACNLVRSNPFLAVNGAGQQLLFHPSPHEIAHDYDNKLGKGTLIKEMQTTGILNDGRESEYALGLLMSSYRGLPIVEHDGGMFGYHSEFSGSRIRSSL